MVVSKIGYNTYYDNVIYPGAKAMTLQQLHGGLTCGVCELKGDSINDKS